MKTLFLTVILSLSKSGLARSAPYHIIGGDSALTVGRYPFFVNFRRTEINFNDLPFCGGAIIMPVVYPFAQARFVLTAAHCVCNVTGDVPNSDYNSYVAYGNNYHHQFWGVQGVQESRLVHPPKCHPGYLMIKNNLHIVVIMAHDIAIVELATPWQRVIGDIEHIELDNSILLTDVVDPFAPYYSLTAVGFGTHFITGEPFFTRYHPWTLKVRNGFLLQNNIICGNNHGDVYDHSTTFCIREPNSALCDGDSGDPVFYKDDAGISKLVGISSIALSNCDPGDSTMAMRISYYIPWIEANVN